jgi:hypothetical protein
MIQLKSAAGSRIPRGAEAGEKTSALGRPPPSDM